MSRTLFKFCPPFDEDTPAVHFWKAVKSPRNTASLASPFIKHAVDHEFLIVPFEVVLCLLASGCVEIDQFFLPALRVFGSFMPRDRYSWKFRQSTVYFFFPPSSGPNWMVLSRL